MKLSMKNGKHYLIFLVLYMHLYIGNPYIREPKVICNKAVIFIYNWGVLRIFHYGEKGGIIQKMTKFLPFRVLPSTKFLFLPHKSPPPRYCYLEWDIKVSEKVIKTLTNKTNKFSPCSRHFNNNMQ